MSAVNKLLDKARDACSARSDAALADHLQVSRQLVSQWRKGANPLSDDRIAQIARVAEEDGGAWLLLIHAEQASGQAKKDWATLARRLGAAAVVVLAVALPLVSQATTKPEQGQAIYIMRSVRRWLRSALQAFQPRSLLHGTPAVLA